MHLDLKAPRITGAARTGTRETSAPGYCTRIVLCYNRATTSLTRKRLEMSRNVTIRLDEAIVRRCRHSAVEEDKSLSQWIADVLTDAVSTGDVEQAARERALRRLEEGFSLGGAPLTREELYGE